MSNITQLSPEFILQLVTTFLTIACNILVILQNERSARRMRYVGTYDLDVSLSDSYDTCCSPIRSKGAMLIL